MITIGLINNILLSISLIFIIYLAAYTLTKGISYKKPWFMGMCACVFFYCLGTLISSISVNADGAMMGTRIEYIGSAFITTFVVMFVADFCQIRIPAAVKAVMWIIPVAVIALLWTTHIHGLIYENYEYVSTAGIGRLRTQSGPLRLVVHIYTAIGMAFSLIVLTYRFFSRKREHKLNMILLILGILVPTATHLIYVFGMIIIHSDAINYVPISLTIASAIFFPNVIKLDLFEVITKASDLALQSITEAFVLIDPKGGLLSSNAAASKIFPQLANLKNGDDTSSVEYWPFNDLENTDYSADIQFELPGSKYYVANVSTISNKRNLLGYIILITDITEIMSLRLEAEQQSKTIIESINYAGKIQRSLLPKASTFGSAFSDFSVIWKPRDIVGGDVYWLRQFDKGAVLCVADCTGHGTPGALLTMLVVSTLDSIVGSDSCEDTAGILYGLDQRLSMALGAESSSGSRRKITDIDDGCDIAVVFISNDGSVRFSSGNISVFICDGTQVAQHKGQRLFIGEGKLESRNEVDTVAVPADVSKKFYIASDGLFEQIGKHGNDSSGSGKQFGYETFKQIILSSHKEKLDDITAGVWQAYEQHRGIEKRRDDFELIAFRP